MCVNPTSVLTSHLTMTLSKITSDGIYRIKVLNKDSYAKYIHDKPADPWVKLTSLDTSSDEQKVSFYAI